MRNPISVAIFMVFFGVLSLAQSVQTGLHGAISDPSGARISGATVTLRGNGVEQQQTTDPNGQYAFAPVPPGKYQIQISAPDFKLEERKDFDLNGAAVLNAQLTLDIQTQVVTVQETATTVGTDPDSNADALVLAKSELDTLSDDPDELAEQLQALAGPGAGPQGGQIYTDGFTGTVPPKSSIREIRINSNPFSSEYDQPGFGRIEILTKPGTDTLHGQFFSQFNNQEFNSRSALFAPSALPPYKNFFWSGSLGGPIKKERASFTFDFNHRDITENAFILATNLDSNQNPQTINEALLTPQTFTELVPRLDLAISSTQTLIVRYDHTQSENDNLGAGGVTLPEAVWNRRNTGHTFQITETALLNPKLVTETRFQFTRFTSVNSGAGSLPSIAVQDAFIGGSARVGNSSNIRDGWEMSSLSILNQGNHALKWGARARQSFNNDTAYNNFNGTFTFFGGTGPMLDANNQPIAGTSMDLTGLQVYQRTLQLQKSGFSAAQIRADGGGASLFSLGAGTPLTRVVQLDFGAFLNDDWKVRPNITLSYGLRYETQTNISDHEDWAPRLSLAWGLDAKGTTPAKTVLRFGSGIFYFRVSDGTILNARRYNGVTQQSYLLTNPDFFPTIPSLSSLASSVQPQTITLLSSSLQAARNLSTNVGVDRQINKYLRFSFNYYGFHALHMVRTRDVNAPLPGTNIYPYGDSNVRMMSESSGIIRQHSVNFNPTLNYKKLSLYGYFGINYSRADIEGLAADPYNLRAEYGPAFGDVRYRANFGPSIPLPFKIMVNSNIIYNSASAYNITTGLPDPSGDGSAYQRPALMNLSAAACTGTTLKYVAQFGCFNLAPAPGTPTIARNYARGPNNINMSLRVARTWGFIKKEVPGGTSPGMVAGPGGPPQGAPIPMKYNMTLAVQALNPLNHPNFANPNGNLSSPFFGQPQSLQGTFGPGNGTYNRKVTMQMQCSF